ncbi:polysaccharide deacetylase family protein [Spirillospora sp. NPDC047279]|uniref:polysaccharide deacetylase family protein n=1 Tax=Spirillospora sp. NPDC047279 TaxID=3155478 RepID=UPI0033EA0859
MKDSPGKGFPFVVSVHDVAASTAEPVARWLDDLDERGVPATLLLIPGPFGGGPGLTGAPDLVSFAHKAAGRGHELSLHGFLHEGVPGGPRWRHHVNSLVARGAGEFWSLTENEARDRLRAGLEALADADIGVVGFTPPGWLASPGTRRALAALGFAYWTSHLAVHRLPDGPPVRMPALSHRPGGFGERTGARLMVEASRVLSRAGRPFRIALHPADLARPGLRRAALTAIDRAVAAGGRPVTYETLVTE